MSWRDSSVEDFLNALAAPRPAPAAGAATAAACAAAAALVELAAGAEHPAGGSAAALRRAALDLVDRDGSAYAGLVEAQRDPEATDADVEAARLEATRTPLAIAEAAVEVAALGRRTARQAGSPKNADAEAAVDLARAACAAALKLVEANLGRAGDRTLLSRARALAAELSRQ